MKTETPTEIEKNITKEIDIGIDYANPHTVWKGINQIKRLVKKKSYNKGIKEGRTQTLKKVKEKIEEIIRLCPAECVNRWIQFEDELSKLEDDGVKE